MVRIKSKIELKEEVQAEIDYFRKWVRKSKNLKTKKKLMKHYIKLLKNKKSWNFACKC